MQGSWFGGSQGADPASPEAQRERSQIATTGKGFGIWDLDSGFQFRFLVLLFVLEQDCFFKY